MIKILAIGNSFSEDATYYLHQIGEAGGIENMVVNLFVGGCSLERHWENILRNTREYQYQINGVKTDRYVSIEDMLRETKWDIIVTHQASHDSGWLESYEPFMGSLVDYLNKNAPGAQIYLNETWAYEPDSDHGKFTRYHRNQKEMYDKLQNAYTTIAKKYSLPLIPCGDVIQKLRSTKYFPGQGKGMSICRDGFHMNYLYGRYALACMWAKYLFGLDISDNTFIPSTEYMAETADMEIIKAIKNSLT